MLRKMVCAGFLMAAAVGFAAADEFRAMITKVGDDGKVTFTKTTFNKETKKIEKGESTSLPTSATVKVVSTKFNRETKKAEAGEPLAGGLKNEKFKNIDEKGLFATIVTDESGKTITEIKLGGFGGGFKKKKKDAE